jgi:hypothetical protein
LRKDIHDALTALRDYAENQSSHPSLILINKTVYKQRELEAVHTTRVGEWEFGYRVMPLNEEEGFFLRTVFMCLHGGRLGELSDSEVSQVIMSVASAVLDEGSQTNFEPISPSVMAIHQPFAVMFWREGNPNLVTPSKNLILGNNGGKP